MPQEEKPTLVQLATAHAYGFRPLRPINKDADTHYVRVTRNRRTKRILIEILPHDLLERAKPPPSGSSAQEWWADPTYAARLRALVIDGAWDKARRYQSSKGKIEAVK